MPFSLKHLFPVLCIAGYLCVWRIFVQNGAFDYMSVATRRGAYPDGTIIRKQYTGVRAVDDFLMAMVAFNLPVTVEPFLLGRLYLAQFLGNVLVLLLITSVEGHRRLNRRTVSQFSTIWFCISQTLSSAIVIPIYCYARLLKPSQLISATRRGVSIPATISKILIPSLLTGFILPMALMLYPLHQTPSSHHKWIAVFQLFPLYVFLTQQVLAFLLHRLRPTLSDEREPFDGDFNDVQRSCAFAGLFAAGIHLYTVGLVIRNPALSLVDFFWPNYAVEGFDNQVLLFLKFDYLFTFVSLLLWVYLELELLGHYDMARVGRYLLAGTVLVGPGATAAIAWAIREKDYRRLVAAKEK